MEYRYCTINDHELCLVFVNKRDQYIFMWRIPAPLFSHVTTIKYHGLGYTYKQHAQILSSTS